MKILMVTALFPPDVAAPAPYIKELAMRLTATESLTLLLYGRLPEAVDQAELVTIQKTSWTPIRLWQFLRELVKHAKTADVVLVHNAPSTELPLVLASFLVSARWLLLKSDTKIKYTGWRAWLHDQACARATCIDVTLPQAKPETTPFSKPTELEWEAYEASWGEHLAALQAHFQDHAH